MRVRSLAAGVCACASACGGLRSGGRGSRASRGRLHRAGRTSCCALARWLCAFACTRSRLTPALRRFHTPSAPETAVRGSCLTACSAATPPRKWCAWRARAGSEAVIHACARAPLAVVRYRASGLFGSALGWPKRAAVHIWPHERRQDTYRPWLAVAAWAHPAGVGARHDPRWWPSRARVCFVFGDLQ